MGKILVGLNVAADGVIEGPGPDDNFDRAGWVMSSFAPETGQIIGENLMNSDALLLGRVTYEVFKASFAHQTDPMSMGLNNVPKYVVSNTLKTADWNNSTLISGSVIEQLRQLKDQGKRMTISGSARLVHSLQQADLIDEYALFVYPVVVGKGIRLFESTDAIQPLKLLEARPLSAGVVYLRYAAGEAAKA